MRHPSPSSTLASSALVLLTVAGCSTSSGTAPDGSVTGRGTWNEVTPKPSCGVASFGIDGSDRPLTLGPTPTASAKKAAGTCTWNGKAWEEEVVWRTGADVTQLGFLPGGVPVVSAPSKGVNNVIFRVPDARDTWVTHATPIQATAVHFSVLPGVPGVVAVEDATHHVQLGTWDHERNALTLLAAFPGVDTAAEIALAPGPMMAFRDLADGGKLRVASSQPNVPTGPLSTGAADLIRLVQGGSRALVAFRDQAGATHLTYWQTSAPGTTHDLTLPSAAKVKDLALAIEAYGTHIFVASVDDATGQLQVSQSDWSTWKSLTLPQTALASRVSLAATKLGVMAAWCDEGDAGKRARVMEWTGTAWTDLGHPVAGACRGTALAMDFNLAGALLGVSYDDAGTLRFQRLLRPKDGKFAALGPPAAVGIADAAVMFTGLTGETPLSIHAAPGDGKPQISRWATGGWVVKTVLEPKGSYLVNRDWMRVSKTGQIFVLVKGLADERRLGVYRSETDGTWSDLGLATELADGMRYSISVDGAGRPLVLYTRQDPAGGLAVGHVARWQEGTGASAKWSELWSGAGGTALGVLADGRPVIAVGFDRQVGALGIGDFRLIRLDAGKEIDLGFLPNPSQLGRTLLTFGVDPSDRPFAIYTEDIDEYSYQTWSSRWSSGTDWQAPAHVFGTVSRLDLQQLHATVPGPIFDSKGTPYLAISYGFMTTGVLTSQPIVLKYSE